MARFHFYGVVLLALIFNGFTCLAEDDVEAKKKISELLINFPDNEKDHADFIRRNQVLTAVHSLGDKSIEILGSFLDEGRSYSTRRGAAYVLGELNDKRAIPILMKFISTVPSGVEIEVRKALGRIDDPDLVDELVKDVEADPKSELAGAATGTISDLSRKSSTPKLLPLLKHRNPSLRLFTAMGLGNIKDDSAVDSLVEALNDENDGVVMKVAQSLGEIGNTKAIKPLTERLNKAEGMFLRHYLSDAILKLKKSEVSAFGKKEGQTEQQYVLVLVAALRAADPELRRKAAIALRTVKEISADACDALGDSLADDNAEVRSEATQSLVELGPKGAAALIKQLPHKNAEVRRLAIAGLRLVKRNIPIGEGFKEPIAEIAEHLSDADLNVRRVAAVYLSGAHDIPLDTSTKLIAALSDKDDHVASMSAVALAEMGLPVEKDLIQALSSADERVRTYAAFALGQTGVLSAALELLHGQDLNFSDPHFLEALDAMRMRPNAKGSIPALIKTLDDPILVTRITAATALGRMRTDAHEAAPALKRMVQDAKENGNVRAVAAFALGQVTDDASPILLSIVKDGAATESTRSGACFGLVNSGKAAVGPLIKELKENTDEKTCALILQVLGKIGKDAKDAIPAIEDAQKRDSKVIKEFAARALKAISGKD
jgi:HEAT repeat protein